MSRRFIAAACLISVFTFWLSAPLNGAVDAPKDPVSGESAAVVIDAHTGSALSSNSPDRVLASASLTKLMTALLVVEKDKLSDTVTVGREVFGVEGSVLGLQPGDRITVENLLYGLLVHSGNDAANALAVYTAGSQEGFVGMMNARAQSIGLATTHFVNPSGLPAPGHVSSARDIALLARTVLQNSVIRAITSTKEAELTWQDKKGRTRRAELANTNRLLGLYPGVTGVKTGTTTEAGQCLVTFAQWDAGQVILVLLKSANRYAESIAYLDHAYAELQLGRAGSLLLQNSLFSF